ncbi:MAG TPA: MBL fold metallo-hydrolase [Thermoanaerobaculia bacterium]|nr:MBL fold metallo-hydrolase [Thermoanaerobaculia bacterium]
MGTLLAVWIGILSSPAAPTAVVLGIAQDGGVPHAGCHQELCVSARRDPSLRKRVASLGLVDPAANRRFLIDATPDFADQMERLGGVPDGILLTHAHIGHYLGLAQLGREVLDAKKVPVYATARMARFLRENRPWSRLVAMGNIEIREIEPHREFALTPRLSATAIRVPHRDADSDTDTVAYLVRGPGRKILWLPDIDRWDRWDRRLADFLADPETIVFVDGTFFSADEIPGRSLADIPHPLVPDTMSSLAAQPSARGRVFFIHLNHTNRLLWDDEAVRAIEAKGFAVAREGQTVSFTTTSP